MSVIHTEQEKQLDARLLIFPSVMALALGIMFVRLWYLQVVQAPILTERALTFQFTSVAKLAPRGVIVDRRGELLAGVRPQIIVTAKPGIVRKHPEVLQRLAEMVGVPIKKLQEKVGAAAFRPYLPSAIFVGASIEVATRIAESEDELPGLGVETQPMRFYPDTVNLSHILGYVWTPTDKDVKRLAKQGRKPAEYVGKSGIEHEYELELMGKPGSERMEVDARRRPIRSVSQDNALPGDKLVLSLDSSLQKLALEKLAGSRGAIVALDPRSGEVLCLASSPTFDASIFQHGISSSDWDKLENDPAHPQINRAIYASYAPGSTFKIVTTLASMEEGKFSPTETIFCPGYYQVGNKKFKCLGHHGAISFERALAKSCNTYFSTLGVRAGVAALRRVCEQVGLGHRTGIDLLGEGRGIVPTQAWIKRWRKPARWYPGDTVNLSVGQGEISVTPLQMACLVALVANRGASYKPHLVRAIFHAGQDQGPQYIKPVESAKINISDADWTTLQQAMVSVVEGGTADVARIPGLQWGGKTGSAENRRNAETHSWFVGIAPMTSPKIVVCVVVENAGHGSDVAAPIAREIVRHYLTGRNAKVDVQSTSKPAAADDAFSAAPTSPKDR